MDGCILPAGCRETQRVSPPKLWSRETSTVGVTAETRFRSIDRTRPQNKGDIRGARESLIGLAKCNSSSHKERERKTLPSSAGDTEWCVHLYSLHYVFLVSFYYVDFSLVN